MTFAMQIALDDAALASCPHDGSYTDKMLWLSNKIAGPLHYEFDAARNEMQQDINEWALRGPAYFNAKIALVHTLQRRGFNVTTRVSSEVLTSLAAATLKREAAA